MRGQSRHLLAHAEPVDEVVADVVANEREHGHRIAADDADLPRGGGGGFGAERRAEVDAVHPVERLEDERDRSCCAGRRR